MLQKEETMKRRIMFFNSFLSILVFACTSTDDNSYAIGNSNQTITHNGMTREYILYIPESYDSNIPTHVVINFHGFGGNALKYSELIGDFYNLHSLANSENFIVVYPQGVERKKGAPEWDPGNDGSQNINDNDVFFTEQLISNLSNTYNVDASKVYAVGYSNGGMMAYGLACSKSNLIAAVGIMSGTMLEDTCDKNAYTSIIHFHGLADEVLPYSGNQYYQSISDMVDFWLNHNNIPVSNLIKTQLNNGNIVRDEYTGGNDNTSLILYTINSEFGKSGGHVWFSDEINGASPNQILWDFLSTYSLDD